VGQFESGEAEQVTPGWQPALASTFGSSPRSPGCSTEAQCPVWGPST